MSVPALPPTSPSRRSAAAVPGRSGRGRAHLRVVTEDFVPRPRLDGHVVPLAPESRRRPATPRPGFTPRHPAVRAARRRELEQARGRVAAAPHEHEVVARAGAVGVVPPAVSVRVPGPAVRTAVATHSVRGAWGGLPLAVRRALAAALLVIALAVAGGAGLVVSGLLVGPTETTTTVVQEGQSLWQVATASGSEDVAETVAQIVEINGLDDATVHAGQTLLVPVG